MPMANVPAVQRVLDRAELTIADMRAIKTHNPFAVNDCFLSREPGIPLERMNNFGSSRIWGHPQGPTGMRLIIELIEEIVLLGGGYGLFTGCAGGDTAMAVVLKVLDRRRGCPPPFCLIASLPGVNASQAPGARPSAPR